MAVGVASMLFYILLALRGLSVLEVRIGNVLFYVGIVTLPLGAILLWTGEMKHHRENIQ